MLTRVTYSMVLTIDDSWHAKKESSLHGTLEDGTLPFHSIFALGHAIDVHQRLYGSMSQISAHTSFLAKYLYDCISTLTHFNQQPVCHVYKDPEAVYGDPKTQGATIAFNVQGPDGQLVPFREVEKAANWSNVYIRSGTLCNPGGIATFLNLDAAKLKFAYAQGHRCNSPSAAVQGKYMGVVRVSLGAMSTLSDVNRFLQFLRENYVIDAPWIPTDTLISRVDSQPQAALQCSTTIETGGKTRKLVRRIASRLRVENHDHSCDCRLCVRGFGSVSAIWSSNGRLAGE